MGNLIASLALLKSRVKDIRGRYTPCFNLTSVEERDGTWVDGILNLPSGTQRLTMDSNYRVCGLDDWQRVIEWDFVDQKQYLKDLFDCEDFAFHFKSRCAYHFGLNSVGLVIDWSAGHGYNVILLSDGRMLVYEPQTDEYWELKERPGEAYKMANAIILL